MTMLNKDETAKAVPIRKDDWIASFPHLRPLIGRLRDQGRYDRFELITLRKWSSGCVAVIGDAAHAMPPNIGQGGGCAMMNALSMAVYLDQNQDVCSALAAWERAERPLTDHTQRISRLLGLPTTWPAILRRWSFALAGKSKRITEMRTRTARHMPIGTFNSDVIRQAQDGRLSNPGTGRS
jgi:2-polyprenyl-6-methoxyphenol hydroxylase-like FAD-dependent oxidoreductase